MGVTYTVQEHKWLGNQRIAVVEAQFDASYTAGGEPLAANDVDFDDVQSVLFEEPVSEGGYVAAYRDADGTIKMYETGGAGATLSEVAGATDLSTESVTLQVWGRS